jgi:hypothetical protein
MIPTSTLRPGLLVSLKTSLKGNVSYSTQDIEPDHLTDAGERKARWETLRTVANPDEHEAAVKVRSKARSLVSATCSASAFGLLCPENRAAELDKAIVDARDVIDAFNASASCTAVSLYVIAGRIAADDVEAARAIRSEVTDLLNEMEQGIVRLDVKAVREAANKARSLGQMLQPEAAARLQDAIAAARRASRAIIKAGDAAAAEIDNTVLARLAAARTAFLDLDDATAPVAMPEAEAREIDMDPNVPVPTSDYYAAPEGSEPAVYDRADDGIPAFLRRGTAVAALEMDDCEPVEAPAARAVALELEF